MENKYVYEFTFLVNSNECAYCSLGKVNIVLNNEIKTQKDYNNAIKIVSKSFALTRNISNYKNKFNCKNTHTVILSYKLLGVFEESKKYSFDFEDLVPDKKNVC